MKNIAALLFLLTGVGSSVYSLANTFIAGVPTRDDGGEQNYHINIFEVYDDTELKTKQLSLALENPDDLKVTARVSANILRVMVGDQISKQYLVGSGLKVTEISPPTEEPENPEISKIRMRSLPPVIDNSFVPVALSPNTNFEQLDDQLFLVVDSDAHVWVQRRTQSGYSVVVGGPIQGGYQTTSFVEYSKDKVAYVDNVGRVRRFELGPGDRIISIQTVGRKLLRSISRYDVSSTCAILNYQLLPIDRIDPSDYPTCLDKLFETKNTKFIMDCLTALSATQDIPFALLPWLQNPLVSAAQNADLSTFDAIRKNWPNLISVATQTPERNSKRITPLEAAVAGGNLQIVQRLLDDGVDPRTDKQRDGLYSKAASPEMKRLLESIGFGEEVEIQSSGTCNDDSVNVRKTYSKSSAVIGKLGNGARVQILAVTAHKYSVDGYAADYWYKIESQSLVGWVFGHFITEDDTGSEE